MKVTTTKDPKIETWNTISKVSMRLMCATIAIFFVHILMNFLSFRRYDVYFEDFYSYITYPWLAIAIVDLAIFAASCVTLIIHKIKDARGEFKEDSLQQTLIIDKKPKEPGKRIFLLILLAVLAIHAVFYIWFFHGCEVKRTDFLEKHEAIKAEFAEVFPDYEIEWNDHYTNLEITDYTGYDDGNFVQASLIMNQDGSAVNQVFFCCYMVQNPDQNPTVEQVQSKIGDSYDSIADQLNQMSDTYPMLAALRSADFTEASSALETYADYDVAETYGSEELFTWDDGCNTYAIAKSKDKLQLTQYSNLSDAN